MSYDKRLSLKHWSDLKLSLITTIGRMVSECAIVDEFSEQCDSACSESQPFCSSNLGPDEDRIKDTSKWLGYPFNIAISVLSCRNPRFQDGHLSNRYLPHLQIAEACLGSSHTNPGRNHFSVFLCSIGTLSHPQSKHYLSVVSLAKTIWHFTRIVPLFPPDLNLTCRGSTFLSVMISAWSLGTSSLASESKNLVLLEVHQFLF